MLGLDTSDPSPQVLTILDKHGGPKTDKSLGPNYKSGNSKPKTFNYHGFHGGPVEGMPSVSSHSRRRGGPVDSSLPGWVKLA